MNIKEINSGPLYSYVPLTLATVRTSQGNLPAFVSQESVGRWNRLLAMGPLLVTLKPVIGYGVNPNTGEYERNRDEERNGGAK